MRNSDGLLHRFQKINVEIDCINDLVCTHFYNRMNNFLLASWYMYNPLFSFAQHQGLNPK